MSENKKRYKGIMVFTNDIYDSSFTIFMHKLNTLKNKWFKVDYPNISNIISDDIEEKINNYFNDNYICLVFLGYKSLTNTTNVLLRAAFDGKVKIFTKNCEDANYYLKLYDTIYKDKGDIDLVENVDKYLQVLQDRIKSNHIFIGIVSDNKKFVIDLFNDACLKAKSEKESHREPVILRNSCNVSLCCFNFTGILKVYIAPKTQPVKTPTVPIRDEEKDPRIAYVDEVLSIRYNDGLVITYHYINPSTIADFSNIDLYNDLYVDLNTNYKTLILPRGEDIPTRVHPFSRKDLPGYYREMAFKYAKYAESESFENKKRYIINEIMNYSKNLLRYFYNFVDTEEDDEKYTDNNYFTLIDKRFFISCPVLKEIYPDFEKKELNPLKGDKE